MEKTQRPNDSRTCRFCRYFDPLLNPAAGTAQFLCRRNAPAASGIVVGMTPPQQDPVTKQMVGPQPIWAFATLWPAISPTDWCGEWSKKLEEVK
jgi:hypothetical protein